MGTDDLIFCELCKELTHPRANGDQICPKHPNSFAGPAKNPQKDVQLDMLKNPIKRKKSGDDL